MDVRCERTHRFVKVAVLFALHSGSGSLVYWSRSKASPLRSHSLRPSPRCCLLPPLAVVGAKNPSRRENITRISVYCEFICGAILCVARIHRSTYYIQMRICNDQRTAVDACTMPPHSENNDNHKNNYNCAQAFRAYWEADCRAHGNTSAAQCPLIILHSAGSATSALQRSPGNLFSHLKPSKLRVAAAHRIGTTTATTRRKMDGQNEKKNRRMNLKSFPHHFFLSSE